MTALTPPTYEELEVESSNLLLERDALLVRGQGQESAARSRQAGEMRRKMGEMLRTSGRVAEAVEDWLSAAQCFLDAHAAERAGEVIVDLQALLGSGAGQVRPDLIREVERRIGQLSQIESGRRPAE